MIALTDPQTVALITAGGGVVVAVVGLVGVLLARQNTKQHGAAISERQKDREERDRDRAAAIEAREAFAKQIHERLDAVHEDVQFNTGLLIQHIENPDAHGRGGPRAA